MFCTRHVTLCDLNLEISIYKNSFEYVNLYFWCLQVNSFWMQYQVYTIKTTVEARKCPGTVLELQLIVAKSPLHTCQKYVKRGVIIQFCKSLTGGQLVFTRGAYHIELKILRKTLLLMVKPGGWDPPHSRSMYPVLKETPGWKLFGGLFDRSTLTLCWGWTEGWQDVTSCFSTQSVCAGFCRTPGPLLSYLNVCCGCFTWRFTIKSFFLSASWGA